MATTNVSPATRDRILGILGEQAMTKRRLAYLAECSQATLFNLIEAGDLVIIGREKPAVHFRVIKGMPIVCAAAHVEKHKRAA